MDNNNVLYIFKYSATSQNNQNVSDYFLATSLDDCVMFFDILGYTNIDVQPLKVGEAKPDFNSKIDLKNISIELADLANCLKANTNLFDGIVAFTTNCTNEHNKRIYYRLAYFVYKGDPLSTAMRKLGDIIPTEIIEYVELGELQGDIPSQLAVLVRKYAGPVKEKKGLLSGLIKDKKDNKSKSIANEYKSNLSARGMSLYPFKYIVKDESGKKIVGYFNAESIDDCNAFLTNQGFTIVKVEPKKSYDIEIVINKKIKLSTLAFDLTQLSTYLKAGIALVDAVSILAKQAANVASRNAYQRLVYDLLKGDNLSTAMERQGEVFPRLLINMVKSAEMTGDLTSILDDMAEYYEDVEQTRKTMISALTYPVFVLVLAVLVFAFMMVVLVPQFVTLYQSNGAQLPGITLFVIGISNFITSYYIFILLILTVLITTFVACYKNIEDFKRVVQTIIMKIPSFGKIIIYNEIYTFTKTFGTLLNHGVFITDSMEILSNITQNVIYQKIIEKTLNNLSKGEKISDSFKGEWAFPVVAYHMIVTGENTGQLGLMMSKVSEHYGQLHKTLVNQIKSLLEPIMILVVAFIVGIILLSIVTPMFDIYNQIR